jgi:glycosyltransferase involved in cell wall biosynthesis
VSLRLGSHHNADMVNSGASVHMLGDSLEGGLGQGMLSESNYLSSIGWQVMLSAPSVPHSMKLDVGVAFAPTPVPKSISDVIGMAQSIFTFRRQFQGSRSPNLLHAHGLRSFLVARLAFPLTPLVITFHGAPPRGRVRRTFFRFAANASCGAISVAPIDVPGWEHWWHWSPAIATDRVEPHVDALKVGSHSIEVEGAKRPHTPLTLGWLGRFESPKRPDRWVAVLASARASGIDIRGVMAGDGPLLEQTRRETLNLNLDVDFLGWQTAVAALSQMDVLLTWSDSEGVPFVIQEALWAGTPCITNNLPGPTAFLGPGELGVVDEDSVVGVLRMLINPKARSELHLKQITRLQTLLAEGRAEWKFASRYQHLAASGP